MEKQEERKKEKKFKKGKKIKGKKETNDLVSSAVSAITGSKMTIGKSFHSILTASENGEEDDYLENDEKYDEEEGRIETPITQLKKKSKTKSDSSCKEKYFIFLN